jgi:RimJ/RimL family protein N-acetyltransferase
MGYWIGKAYWGQGYTTEAACLVPGYCFEQQRFEDVVVYGILREEWQP